MLNNTFTDLFEVNNVDDNDQTQYSSTSITKHPTQKWNRKQAVNAYRDQFTYKFDIDEDAIDLRTMAQNYDNGIIPLDDIHRALVTILGPNYAIKNSPFDPAPGWTQTVTNSTIIPQFGYVNWDDIYLWSIFQRDIAPNHVEKIYKDFEPTCVIVPCAIKITIDGKTYYCVWDGHHTIQVMRLKNYIKFPMWYIDIDQVTDETILKDFLKREGSVSQQDRIDYACWLAGQNMIRINSTNKRKLHQYDEFMILLETKDKVAVSMNRFLSKNNCQPKRRGVNAGDFSQIKSGLECYELADNYGNKGQFWDKALAFHRKYWPGAPLELELFRPMSLLYYQAYLEGLTLDQQFDQDLFNILHSWSKGGSPESIQTEIKDSYWKAVNNKLGVGQQPDHDKGRVLAGIINLYNSSTVANKVTLPIAEYRWKV